MKQYLDQLKLVLEHGEQRIDRTGTGTISLFGLQASYDLEKCFPAPTTKKLAFESVLSELLWFIEGSTDEKRLREILHGDRNSTKNTIWTANASAPYWKPKSKFDGDVGVIYGAQWRNWKTYDATSNPSLYTEGNSIDQLGSLITSIKNDPTSRRHILTAWNPAEFSNMALPPCHVMSQFYVQQFTQSEIDLMYAKYYTENIDTRCELDTQFDGKQKTIEILNQLKLPTGKLQCQLYQRSCDLFLGGPYNIASYAILTHLIAQVCDLIPSKLIHVIGDAHIYLDHIVAVKEQLSRPILDQSPRLLVNPDIENINDFTMTDIRLHSYNPHPAIRAKMSV